VKHLKNENTLNEFHREPLLLFLNQDLTLLVF